ncbi:MAG: thioredoxin [candidate division WOR-3 bacterium]
MALELTRDNFKAEILDSPLPAIVDFWAGWCGPCRMIGPVIEELSQEYAGKIKVGKVDIDQQSEVAGQYGVMSIPTLLFIKGGKVLDTIVGAVPKKQIIERIEAVFGKL